MIKNFVKALLPAPVWNALRRFKQYTTARIKIALSMPLKEKIDKIKFEVHLSEHCNLNCMGCNNFSCIAEPEFVDPDEFKRDFTRMGELFGHVCDRIYLLGGEPLLNPDIITLMKIARENFTDGNIYVFTNGILLPKKGPEFWTACHDNNIGILISAYPIKIDIDAIRSLSEKFSVCVNWAWDQQENERNTFHVATINLSGDSSIPVNFYMCTRGNQCITLSHGRLFTCTFAPHVHHFNKFFGQHIEITEADYINIYSDITSDEILNRLREPIPACRYCVTAKPSRKFTWGLTRKDIHEWL